MNVFLVSISVLTSVFAAQAAEGTLAVFAKEEGVSSTNIAGTGALMKRFTITLQNAGLEDVDLSHGCLVLSNSGDASDKGDVYYVDTVDEDLVTGLLKPDATVEGPASFVGASASILDAHFVHYLEACPSE